MKNTLKIFFNALFLLTPGSQAGFRVAAAATFSVFIALSLHLGMPYWSSISVIAVTQAFLGNTLEKGIMRILGTIIGAFLGLVLGTLVATNFIYFTLSCFLTVFLGYYFSMQSKYPYAYILGAMTCFLILGMILVDPSFYFSTAIWRTSEVIIGVIGSVIMSFLIFPSTPETKIKKLFEAVAKEQNQLFTLCLDERFLKNIFEEKALIIKKNLNKCESLITEFEKEYNVDLVSVTHYKSILSFFNKQNRTLYDFSMAAERFIDRKILNDVSLNSSTVFSDLQKEIKIANEDIINNKETKPSFVHYHTFESKIIQLREKRYFLRYEINSVIKFVYFIEQLGRYVNNFEERMEKQADLIQAVVKSPNKFKWNKSQFNNALSSGLGAIIALFIWIASDLPGGLQGIISSYIISLQKNITEKKTLAFYRLSGCAIGGSVGLLSMAFIQFNLITMLGYLFIFTWIFGYLTFSGKPYAPIGTQANIALAISFVQANGLHEISPALERIAGIVIGIVAIFLASYLVAPISAEDQYKTNLERLAALFNQMIKQSIFKTSLDELRKTFFKLIEISHDNLNLLSFVLKNKPNKEQKFYERSSEIFERMASLLLQIKRKFDEVKFDELSKHYQLDFNTDYKNFSDAMNWLNRQFAINQDQKKKLYEVLEMFQNNIQSIRARNLKDQRGILNSKPLVYFYHDLSMILELSIQYCEEQANLNPEPN